MKHKIFCIYDQAAAAFLPPFVLHNEALAARVFGDCVNSRDHQFGMHPEHYALYRIGTYEDGSAVLEAEVPLYLVTTGLMAKKVDGGSLDAWQVGDSPEAFDAAVDERREALFAKQNGGEL